MKYWVRYIPLLFTVFLFQCSDYNSVSDSPNASLSFSRDSVYFDTLVSTISSTTETLMVYNHQSDGLIVQTVSLEKGKESPFRINVDGETLSDGIGEDFLIRKKDSLRVWIEVTPPLVGTNEPRVYHDKIIFRLRNGKEQKVNLSVGAIDAHIVKGLAVTEDMTLDNQKPYVIYDSLVVSPGVRLTLLPGTRLMFHDKTAVDVYGTLVAEGTFDRPVVFRGDRMDHMFDNLKYDNTPGRWEGIRLHAESFHNRLAHCDIHSAKFGIVCDSSDISIPKLELNSSIIHNVSGDGLQLNHCNSSIYNSQISNTLGRSVYIFGGSYEFVHNTIAQYYPFSAKRQEALYLANIEGKNYRDLLKAHFVNCVITGYDEDVIMGSIDEGSDTPVDYLFKNCFLRTPSSSDTLRFIGNVYDLSDEILKLEISGEKNFKLLDTDNFIYDFTPDSLSLIRGLADRSYIDAGCLEYVAP